VGDKGTAGIHCEEHKRGVVNIMRTLMYAVVVITFVFTSIYVSFVSGLRLGYMQRRSFEIEQNIKYRKEKPKKYRL